MSNLDSFLESRIQEIRAQKLYRELRQINSAQGSEILFAPSSSLPEITFLNFSSNDYLGLANHPDVKQAAAQAIEKFGAGSGASRLVSGSLRPHHDLEEELASFKKTGAALTFSSGYATAVGTISALVGRNDIVILDKLVHASIVDAARLSGAKLRVFPHNDLGRLEEILQWCNNAAGQGSERSLKLIITESVFSMDGDHAPLAEIVQLKEKYGAWLMVDEAHASGMYGQEGRGLADLAGVAAQVDVHMGTLGKAFGSAGGYICGSRQLIDFLVNRARSFIFSTAPVPAAAAAAMRGIQIVRSAEGVRLRAQLWERVKQFSSVLPAVRKESAILPLIIGESSAALEAAARLRASGFYVPAIRYPTVARDSARLRITITAAHTFEQVEALKSALIELGLAQA